MLHTPSAATDNPLLSPRGEGDAANESGTSMAKSEGDAMKWMQTYLASPQIPPATWGGAGWDAGEDADDSSEEASPQMAAARHPPEDSLGSPGVISFFSCLFLFLFLSLFIFLFLFLPLCFSCSYVPLLSVFRFDRFRFNLLLLVFSSLSCLVLLPHLLLSRFPPPPHP